MRRPAHSCVTLGLSSAPRSALLQGLKAEKLIKKTLTLLRHRGSTGRPASLCIIPGRCRAPRCLPSRGLKAKKPSKKSLAYLQTKKRVSRPASSLRVLNVLQAGLRQPNFRLQLIIELRQDDNDCPPFSVHHSLSTVQGAGLPRDPLQCDRSAPPTDV